MKNNIIMYLSCNIIFQSIITLHQLRQLIFVEILILITNSVGQLKAACQIGPLVNRPKNF
jgi:hypothetical protein